MKAYRDLAGQRFGWLTAVRRFGRTKRFITTWLCVCDCGHETIVRIDHLVSGNTRSCGCLKSAPENHRSSSRAQSRPGMYRIWQGIWDRCTNPKVPSFADYGARGVVVCERWKSFAAFVEDMGPRPSPRHSVDRKSVNGNYEPKNCRWATPALQNKNRRSSKSVLRDRMQPRLRLDWGRPSDCRLPQEGRSIKSSVA